MLSIKNLFLLLATVLISTISYPETASAQEASSAQNTAKSDADRWSIGAGIGFSIYRFALGGVPGMGYGNAVSYQSSRWPQGVIAVEYGLSNKLSMMFLADGFYAQSIWQKDDSQGNLGLSAGIRWIFNPSSSVEISTYGLLGYQHYWYSGNADPENYLVTKDDDAYTIDAGIGLAFEIPLLENLRLRLSSLLLQANYYHDDRTNIDENSNKMKETRNGFSAGLSFSPSIQLRMTF